MNNVDKEIFEREIQKHAKRAKFWAIVAVVSFIIAIILQIVSLILKLQ